MFSVFERGHGRKETKRVKRIRAEFLLIKTAGAVAADYGPCWQVV